MKTVLFVTYGGGHARMITPVIRELAAQKDIRTVSLALTVGGPIFESEGLPYLGYKDFVTAEDAEALAWGRAHLAGQHNPESGISEEESIAYLGLSYFDLVKRYGAKEAEKLWQEKGRHAFMQRTVMDRVMAKIKPDIVVTTNSPKSEQAAIEAANACGIPTLSMVDLFGIHHFHPLEAEYITVLCEGVVENMWNEGVTRPREAFSITGNPAFDRAFDYRGPVDVAWRKEHFPALPGDKKALLWIDMPAYWHVPTRTLYTRSDEEILRDLDDMAQAAQANDVSLIIRPHPSQQRGLYDAWMKKNTYPHVAFAGGVPLYPLLRGIDMLAVYTSTVSVEALLMQRNVIQLQYYPGHCDVPLGEWQLAWHARKREDIVECVRNALTQPEEVARMKQRANAILPQEKAAPKVAAEIMRILQQKMLQRQKIAQNG